MISVNLSNESAIQLTDIRSITFEDMEIFPNLAWLMTFYTFAAAKPAQRVFKVNMLFPTSVLCNEAGQGVLRQKVKAAINMVNRDWNFCSYFVDGKYYAIQFLQLELP